jgi:DNA helicase-2/ATP-dependent DNA helicase PcrA
MELSPQQLAAVNHSISHNDSFILEAVAGAGKTFTLLRIAEKLTGNNALLAFNKEITLELSEKVKSITLKGDLKIGTRHSFGMVILRKHFKNIRVDANKLKGIARQYLNDNQEMIPFFTAAARMAKTWLCETNEDWTNMADHYNLWDLLPDNQDPYSAIEGAKILLKLSNKNTSIIDFEDMIYLPIIHNLKGLQYDNIMLDEAQDTNKVGIKLLRRMLKPNGRVIAVGDPYQAIYGFTGASSNSLDDIAKEFNALRLPLSVSFRCPSSVVEYAKKWMPNMEPSPTSPIGEVRTITVEEMIESVQPRDAIICRNTKPLVEIAYMLIRKKIPCKVEGRKIGENILKLANRWKTIKCVSQLEEKLVEWAKAEIEKNKKKERNTICQEIEDRVNTLLLIIKECDPEDSIVVLSEKIKELFGDNVGNNLVVLTTIHRAKGKEWDRIFALKMEEFSPSKWAREPWELAQESNLCGVQVTRTRRVLFLVN